MISLLIQISKIGQLFLCSSRLLLRCRVSNPFLDICHDVYEQCGDGPAEEKHRKYFDSKRGQPELAKHESRDTLPTEHLL